MLIKRFNRYRQDLEKVYNEVGCNKFLVFLQASFCRILYGVRFKDFISTRLEYKSENHFNYFSITVEKHYGPISTGKRINIKLDFIIDRIFHGTVISDYLQYDYYRYKRWVRDEFVNEQRRLIIDKTFNTEDSDQFFYNKALFYKRFDRYLRRDWIDTTNCGFDEFEKFVSKHPIFFGKPVTGSFGRGAGCFDISDYDNHEKLFQQFRVNSMLIEQLICQNSEFSAFNPSSVNTLRIVTVLRPNGEVEIMTADIRMGREGRTSDNFHNMGISALIDIETGIVYTKGVDKQGNKYIIHPDSKKQIVGFKIPMWEEIITYAKELAKVIPEAHYVGWDIAICEDGPCAVEGNHMADPDVTQMPDGQGKWPLYKPLIDEAKQAKTAQYGELWTS